MGVFGLSEYFVVKYAAEDPTGLPDEGVEGKLELDPELKAFRGHDRSFGVPINKDTVRILKDNLIRVYDKINASITQLPFYQMVNDQLKGHPYLEEFNGMINNLVVHIEKSNLKECFSYSTRMIAALNALRDDVAANMKPRTKSVELDEMIRRVQDHIWKESKRILNIHNLRGTLIKMPELEGIIDKVVPTWDFGPGKNPAKGLLSKTPLNVEKPRDLRKRLLEEIKKEDPSFQMPKRRTKKDEY